jgi:hypothetical protein
MPFNGWKFLFGPSTRAAHDCTSEAVLDGFESAILDAARPLMSSGPKIP